MSLPFNLENVLKHPSMCLPVVSFDAAVAYVEGADMVSNGGLLNGFREWLVIRVGDGDDLVWWALVLMLAFPEADSPRVELAKCDDQQRLINHLFDLLEDFYQERQDEGLRKIYLDYEKWMRKQSWYKPGWPTWIDL